MPFYQYHAARMNGKKVKGTARAADQLELREQLRKEELFLVNAKEADEAKSVKPLKAIQLAEFCRELGMMIGAGVPLIRALHIMTQRDISARMKDIYTKLHGAIQQGQMLSEAMEQQNGVFPELLVNMYRASEATGSMEETCKKMARHYEKSHRLTSKVKSAAVYPIILIIVTAVVLLVVFLGILPKFFVLFEDLDTELPALTQFMINLSHNLQRYWLQVLIAVLVLILIMQTAIRTDRVRLAVDKIKLKIPMVGKLLKIIYTARFAGSLSSSYASGISMITSLQNTKNTVGNRYIASQFDKVIRDVRSGEPFSKSIEGIDGFDKKLAASILIGEETGQLESMLLNTSDAFDYEAEIALQRLTAIMEPALIIVMAIIIGSVIVAVILPMPTMYNAIGSGA